MRKEEGVKKRDKRAAFYLSPRVEIEAVKNSRGSVFLFSGIMRVVDYSAERILLLSHAGRIELCGKRLEISVLMKGTLEIYGVIEGVSFSYAKS